MTDSCNNCRYRYEDKEWGNVYDCSICETKNDKTLLILGRKGNCPYHEHTEDYGWK